MATPLRHVPSTPLDELRAWLGNHGEADPSAQSRLNLLLQHLRQMALPDLGGRLVKPSSTGSQKRFILGLTQKFDWPEWVPWLQQILQHEQELGVFDEGCAALGRLEVRSALEALQKLAAQRTDPDHQLILRRELTAFEAQQPITFYLGRILEGEGNPRLAHQGARGLVAGALPRDLPVLLAGMDGADPLSLRLLLRVIAELPDEAAGAALLDFFRETLHTLEDLECLAGLAHRLQTGGRASARTDLAAALSTRMEATSAPATAALEKALAAGELGNPLPHLEQLHADASGPYERFLTEALTVLVEGKVARFSAMLSEAQDMVNKQKVNLGGALDQVCACLLRRVHLGLLTKGLVLPALQEAFARYPESGGLDHAFCNLVPVGSEEGLDQVLRVTDPKRRIACLDTLGAREEDALVAFFMRAMQDPIIEVGHRAMHHFGKLPSAFQSVMELFRSGQPDQVRTALRIFTENATKAAAEPLMDFLKTDVRDDLLLEGVQALGAIQHPGAAPVLLDLLHDGKPARLQEALVEALAQLATTEASLGLLAKSAHLKLPQVLIVALEGGLAAFPSFECPLPPEALPALEQLITRCCDEREGEGKRLPAILATQHLYCFDKDLYARLKDAFSDFLFDLRTKGDWDREANDRIAAVVKELGRRGASLGHIAAKEEHIRSLILAVPQQGPSRAPALLSVREALQDPEFIMRTELSQELAGFFLAEIDRKDQDWRDLARLCEIGGLTRQTSLVEPLKELLARSTGLGLKSAAKEALLALGLSEADITRRPPIRSILLLEPSAFFRKRLLAALGQGWEVQEAGSRAEAAPMLAKHPVDLLISEQSDMSGDLRPWLKMQCETRHCRQVLLSTAARDTTPGESWLMGVLYKPYAPDQLLKALEP